MSALVPTTAATLAWFGRRRAAIARGAAAVERLPAPAVLGGLVAVEWACVLALARTVRHAGWIYYQGGDQLWYYSLGWLLGHGEIGKTAVGSGWPVVLAPFARLAGPNLVSALPAIILFNVLVLLPVAMLALYGIAARLGGRLFGYWTLVVWIAVPFVGIAYTNVGYHQRYTELVLPQSLGLTALADFPTMVAALVCVYFCARVLFTETPQLVDAAAAGVAAGAAVAIKPATVLFLVGPALAFAYRRRLAPLGALLAGMAPAVASLAIWKERGLGHIPLFGNAFASERVAAGTGTGMVGGIDVHHYLTRLNWSHLGNNLDLLREHFWSGRVLQWLVIAGLVGIARQSRTALLLVGGSFTAFAIVKGSYAGASVEDSSVFRIMMPAFPAFILLLASIPLLFPHAPQRLLRPWAPAWADAKPRTRRAFVVAALVLSGIIPAAAFAAARTTGGSAEVALLSAGTMPVPVNVDLGLAAQVGSDGRVALHWHGAYPAGGPVFYRVWRGPAAGGDGLPCAPAAEVRSCILHLPEIGVARHGAFVDTPSKGRWIYRIAVAANWLDDPAYGDVYLVSSPVHAVTP
jgi:hypothetical protein